MHKSLTDSATEQTNIRTNLLLFKTHLPSLPPTYWFFQSLTEPQFDKLLKDLEQEQHKDEKQKIRCKVCGHPITSTQYKIEVNGQHHHFFSNPVGMLYEFGCFSSANGCINKGTPTLEHTWFTGYAWRFAFCSNCFMHLGWFYQSEHNHFYGLILENLDEVV